MQTPSGPIYFEGDTSNNFDPFSYFAKLLYLDEEFPEKPTNVHVICNAIPCGGCFLQPECKDGKHKDVAFMSYLKANMPERFI